MNEGEDERKEKRRGREGDRWGEEEKREIRRV